MKDERHIVERMLFYCETVENARTRFGDNFEDFSRDTAYQFACDMAVLQIGELSTHLSPAFIATYSDVPWKKMRGLRNYIAHDYGSLDTKQQWHTLTDSLPTLKQSCIRIVEQMERDAQIADALAYVNQLDAPTAAEALRQDAAPCVSDELEL